MKIFESSLKIKNLALILQEISRLVKIAFRKRFDVGIQRTPNEFIEKWTRLTYIVMCVGDCMIVPVVREKRIFRNTFGSDVNE